MTASKKRPGWAELPASVRDDIEGLLGDRVTDAGNYAGGFSPGFASRLDLAGGGRVFVKAVDGHRWPIEASQGRAEADVAGRLPVGLPVPRLLGARDDGRWVMLAFEHVDGARPPRPAEMERVVARAVAFAQAVTPSPVALGRDHPRLGGWADLARNPSGVARLRTVSIWASDHLGRLTGLERDGLHAAQGDSLVHFDLYPHNVLVTDDRVVFVDWPHARLGAPVIDRIMLLTGLAVDGGDPDRYLRAEVSVDAILAAHAGFLMAGAFAPMPAGLEAIAAEKLRLGTAATRWLERRLTPGSPGVV